MEINRDKINRSWLYGDFVFETIRVANSKIMYADLHFERLQRALKAFQIPLSEFPFNDFENCLYEEIKQNNLTHSRIRLTVARGGNGLYAPDAAQPFIHIQSAPIKPEITFVNNLGVYTEWKRQINLFSNFKSGNSMPQVLASLFAKQNNFDDCLLLNEQGNICCTTSANIFVLKNGIIKTTDEKQGAVSGIMQQVICNTLKVEKGAITLNDIETADEVFLTNAIRKIIPVKQFGERVYETNFSENLFNNTD